MKDGTENPLAHVERRRPDYPLLIAAAVLIVLILAGLVTAVRAGNYTEAAIFFVSAIVLAALFLIDRAASRRASALDDRKVIRWDAASPELQRQNVSIEVRELARLLGVGDDSLTDLLSAYIVAEDLALRQIQQEENLPLLRHVNIGGPSFDAILVDQDLITCVEVAFLVTPDLRQEKIESMLKKVATAIQNLATMKSRLRLRLMLVLVTQMSADEEEHLRLLFTTRRFTETPVDIDIRMLDFEMLQRTYVSE